MKVAPLEEPSVSDGELSDSDSESSTTQASVDTERSQAHDKPDQRSEPTRLADNIRLLKAAYDFAFDLLEVPEEQKSEAQKQDEKRYSQLKATINSLVTKYDAQIEGRGSNLDKYLAFESIFSKSGTSIDSSNIRQLKASLTDEQQPLTESRGIVDSATNQALKLRRRATEFVAGFFLKSKDVAEFEKLPKEKREKIKLIQRCIEIEGNSEISPEAKELEYQKINAAFSELTAKEKRRTRRNIWNILAKQTHRDILFTGDTVTQIASAVAHPISKVIKSDELTTLEKTATVSKKVLKAGYKSGKYLAGKGVESAHFLIKHSIKQPVMAVYRLPTTMVNGLEYLTLQTQALTENDPARKAQLEHEAEVKRKNLGYEGEKFIRAVAASAGIALIDTALISSAGIALPTASGMHTAATHAILIASETVDKIQNLKDGIELIEEKTKTIDEHRKQFRAVISTRRGNVFRSGIKPDSVEIETPNETTIQPTSAKIVPEETITHNRPRKPILNLRAMITGYEQTSRVSPSSPSPSPTIKKKSLTSFYK